MSALKRGGNTPEDDILEKADIEKLNRAFSLLAAPETSYDKVMDMTRDTAAAPADKRLRTHRMTRRAFLACAALSVAAVGTVAYAAASTGFFQTAFGDKGQQDLVAYEVESQLGYTQIMPGRQWADVDLDEAQRLVGDYVEEVNASVSFAGYTLTIGSCVVDENGLAVAGFELENPDGVALSDDELAGAYGYLDLAPQASISMIGAADTSGEHRADAVALVDRDASTETCVVGSLYFDMGARSGMFVEDGVAWYLLPRDGAADSMACDKITFTPAKLLPAQALATDDGSVTASISALGLVLNTPDDAGQQVTMADAATGENLQVTAPEWVTQDIRLTLDDGSEYVVRDGETTNTAGGGLAEDFSSQSVIFNRLIDPADVASVTVNAPDLGNPDIVLLP